MLTSASCCPVCASLKITPIIDFPPVPVDTCRMWSSLSGARSAQKASLLVSYCRECSHVFNRAYDDKLVDYEEEYENSQMFSPRFRQYAEELSDHLIASYDLHQKRIVEIGGGRGDFLRIICDRGSNFGVSFGPSYKPEPGDDIPNNVQFVPDYYTARYAAEPADLIICRHVLEHFSRPRELITTVREAVGNRTGLATCFEVPNGDFILREQAFWEFIYQHVSYFTARSLTELFNQCDFEVHDVQERFGAQFLTIEARASSKGVTAGRLNGGEHEATTAPARTVAGCESIGAAFNACVARWSNYFEQQQAKGRRIIVWGAGAKAVTFLNVVDPAGSAVSHVVDVNPRKTGRFIGGTGQEIVEPSAARELRPEAIVVMNPIYRAEVASAVRAFGFEPQLLVA